jgi:hypothetical protein
MTRVLEPPVQRSSTITTSQSQQPSPDVVAQDAPVVIRRVPRGGSQIIVERRGDQTVITSAALPPDVWRMVRSVEQTAFGLMGLLAAIVILGPFARMYARRTERRAQMEPSMELQTLHRQMEQLQQSVDTMSIEMERISESQRFQSKLLFESRQQDPKLDRIS